MVTNVDEHNRHPMSVHDDQDVIVRNDIPLMDDLIFNVPSMGLDSMSSRYQPPNNNMTADYDMNRVPHFETTYHGMSRVPNTGNMISTLDRNYMGATNIGVRNFDMGILDADARNYMRQPREINRTFTNFNDSASRVEQSVVSGVHHNLLGVTTPPPNSSEILDGNLLSLGYQNNAPSNMNSNASGGNVSHVNMNETFFPTQGQLPNNPLNLMRGSLAGFQDNVDGLQTPRDCASNLTLSGADHFGLQAMSFGHDMSLMPNLHGGHVNVQHTIATPGNRIFKSGIESDARMPSGNTSDSSGAYLHIPTDDSGPNQGLARYKRKRIQKPPFNSSVLQSFHQNAAASLHNSHSRTNQTSPPGINAGEPGCQNMLGLAQGGATSSLSLPPTEGKVYSRNTARDHRSTGQRADITVENELARSSAAGGRQSLKRNSDIPPQTSIQGQRRKITQTSAHQFSPNLLQNALGQIAADHSVPTFTSTADSTIPSAVLKDFPAIGCPTNLTPPVAGTIVASSNARFPQFSMPSEAAFVSPIYNPAASSAYNYQAISLAMPRSTMNPTTSHASTPCIFVSAEMPKSPLSPHLPMTPPTTTLEPKIGTRIGSVRVPIRATSYKRVASRSPASTAGLQKTQLQYINPSMAPPSISDWRSSAIAASAKATPGSRPLQLPSSMPRIQWQGFDTSPTVGFKCMLCKRDLSFAPEGRVVQPPIPPAVAVLPCGHTFHDHCLQLITPEGEAKGPPCIPCAMGEK